VAIRPRVPYLIGALLGAAITLGLVGALSASGVFFSTRTIVATTTPTPVARNVALLDVIAHYPGCGMQTHPYRVTVQVLGNARVLWTRSGLERDHFTLGVLPGTYTVITNFGSRASIRVVGNETYPIVLPAQVMRCN